MIFQRSNTGPGGALQTREVWDSVALTYTVFNGAGAQISQRALTAPEQVEIAARVVAATAETNETTLRTKASQALTANATFLAAAKPGTAAGQASAAYDAAVRLTKECNGLIRLFLNALDDVSGT